MSFLGKQTKSEHTFEASLLRVQIQILDNFYTPFGELIMCDRLGFQVLWDRFESFGW